MARQGATSSQPAGTSPRPKNATTCSWASSGSQWPRSCWQSTTSWPSAARDATTPEVGNDAPVRVLTAQREVPARVRVTIDALVAHFDLPPGILEPQ